MFLDHDLRWRFLRLQEPRTGDGVTLVQRPIGNRESGIGEFGEAGISDNCKHLGRKVGFVAFTCLIQRCLTRDGKMCVGRFVPVRLRAAELGDRHELGFPAWFRFWELGFSFLTG